jgi:lactate permease
MTDIYLIKWLAAFSPIAVVLILMIWVGWGGGRAGAAGWFTAMIMAAGVFGAGPEMLAYAQMKGVLLSINVLYIIWMALVLYNVVDATGAIKAIAAGIQKFSSNKVIQLLLFGWVFGSFLQGVAGYGVPIAVVAPLLAGMGFHPVTAVAVPAIAHSWSVTFGSMGASFQAMMTVTGLGWDYLAPASAGLLGLACYLCGLASMHVYGGWRAVAHSFPAVLIIGTVMAGTQYLLAVNGMWTLGGFGASLTGLVASLLTARLAYYRNNGDTADASLADQPQTMSMGWALSAYAILIVVVSAGVVVSPIREFLGQLQLSMYFPELATSKGWVVAAGFGKKIKIFGHGGALLAYASLISFLVYKAKGYYQPGAARRIWSKTVKSGVSTSLGIVSMVCFALVMDQCGMIYVLAEGISRLFGSVFPLASAWIGLLGAFMTGSNTNSNVVFGALQQQTAQLAGLGVAIILAAQTTGGALGSMVAPAKILVGCSTVGLSGKEAPVLKATLKYGLAITALIGLATAAAIWLGLGG